jgi:ABC-type glycerol-3-phosphate transport system permease component
MRALVFRLVRVCVLGCAVVAALGPVAWIVSTSFKTQVEAAGYPPRIVPAHPTLANYAQVLSSPAFRSALGTSVLIAVGATVLTLLVAYPCAYALVRSRPYGRRALVVLIALAQTVPGIVFVIPLYSEVVQLGLYDTRRVMIVVYAAFLTPFATLTLSVFLRSVPVEVEEAGLIDGCGRIRLLVRVVIPMTRAPLAATATFTCLYAWNEFLVPVVLGGRETVPLTVYVSGFVTQKTVQWGPLTAAVALVLLPVVAVVLVAQRQLVTGLTAGAVKA